MEAAASREGERGFALVVVISVLAVLSVLAAGFAVATRQQTKIAHNTIATARARALADGGVALAMAGLSRRDQAAVWRADGEPRTYAIGGGAIRVSAQDEAGKIDLNWAPAVLIEGILAELAGNAERQSSIIGEIMARRAASRLPAAPPGEVMGAALLGGPRLRDLVGAPFDSVDELLTLPSMTRAVYERLRPFVTVYAQSAHLDPATAPREVLLAVPGMSPEAAARILATRSRGQAGVPAVATADLAGVGQYLAAVDRRSLTITAEATDQSGARFVRYAVVATTADPYHPFRVLEWRQDLGAAVASTTAAP